MNNYKFIVSGGGTGGHIYPAIAIANELKGRLPEAEFLFVGAKGRMEMEKVPQAGYKIEGLHIAGLQRKLTLKNLSFPFKVIGSLWAARKIVKSFKPSLVIGTGGYASGPLLKMAAGMGVPCVIQEQNSFPGITNKLLAPKMRKIFTAYDGLERYFPADKIVKSGNPVRQDLLEIDSKRVEGTTFFKLKKDKTTLLILGGSQGARRVNQLIEKELEFFKQLDIQLIWQCGKLYFNEYKKHAEADIHVHEFLNRMDLAYAAADIIISRSGAGSVSELCIVGKPVVFIPSPNVAEDHQTKNANAIAEKGGALVIKEKDLDAQFEKEFTNLLKDNEQQDKLGKNIKKMAQPDATGFIVDEIMQILNKSN